MEPLHIQVTCRAKWRTSRLPLPSEPRGFCPARFATAGAVWQTLTSWCCDNYWRIGQNHVAFVLRGLPRQVAVVWQTLAHWCCDKYWQILDARAESRHGATAHPGYLRGQMAHIQVTFALRTTWFLPCQICNGWCCVANTGQLVLQ